MSFSVQDAVALVCLTYHEARNVRHPLDKGLVSEGAKYERLRNLPSNRAEAWKQMSKVRACAETGTIAGVAGVFQAVYGLTLRELVELYGTPIWKHHDLGGNRWAKITCKIQQLLDVPAHEPDYRARVERLLEEIMSMHHHTGTVGEKLRKLRGA